MPGHTYRRGKIYWIKFSDGHKTYYASSKSERKRDADKLLSMYLGEIAAGTFKGLKKDLPQATLRVPELLNQFEADCKRRKLRGMDRIISHVNALRQFFGDVPVSEINELQIQRFIDYRLDQGRTERTINRGLQYLNQALKLAHKKKFITEVPAIEKFSEKGNARQGFFDHAGFERVVAHLPEDLQDFVRFGYWSGWRKGEIARLEWSHIHNGAIRLPPELDKSKEGRVIKLVGNIAAIIARREAMRRSDAPWIFYRVRKGKVWPVMRFDKVWKRACEEADVPAERLFHDLRRTAARNMDMAGVHQQVAMKVLGHKTDSMWRRYRISDEQEAEQAQHKTEQFLQASDNLVTK